MSIKILVIFRYQNVKNYQPDGLCSGSSIGCSIVKKTIQWLVIMGLTM